MAWVKAFHVISIIAWMAAMLYLPRLFVYHVDAEPGSKQSETFKVMERRLYRAIMTPAMIASWLFGLWLIIGYQVIDWSQGWVWLKAALVIALSGYHGLMARHVKDFAADRNTRPGRYFRFMNEVPTLMMIGIVIAVIVRPF
ncbi:membrane protein [Devosia pacifica]|uniref:Protoporphyrinogen IX oxidase n=1 Tax=Devosia pacifica TaxID=1335967 RepID=A0A918S3X1_9HYPH|nr:protoporphyrinogen oxidase HemJ [Devosia pacifica]GHA23403.1 membrane protein [Devosia pacifica]